LDTCFIVRDNNGHAWVELEDVHMLLTDRDDIRTAETDDEILIFDVSDDALERAAPIIGGVASVVTVNYGTALLGNCGCPL
jgi:hypothetical protein